MSKQVADARRDQAMMDKYEADNLAHSYHLDLTKDFFTLSAEEVGRVLDAADTMKYRRPKHANGSRGRYFFHYLQRVHNQKG